MRASRRPFAFIAALAVAFGALWPLVSVARAGPQIPSFICSQAGFQHPDSQGDIDDGKFHCPMCVVSVDSALPDLRPVVQARAQSPAARVARFRSSTDFVFFAQPPPSRAPPHA